MEAFFVLFFLLVFLGGSSLIVLKAWINNRRYEREQAALADATTGRPD